MKKIFFFLSLFISVFTYGQNRKIDPSKIFYVDSYGAKHDGSTDDNAAIARAIAAAKANGGGIVHFGASNYATNSTITVDTSNIILEGEGPGATIITGLTDFGNIISFTPSTNPATVAYFFHDVTAKDFSIQTSVTRTSGYAIHSTYTHNARVENVVVGFFRTATAPNNVITKFFNGIAFINESNFVMSNTQIYAWHEGVYVSGKQVGNAFRNTNNFDGLITGNCLILGDTTKWHAADTTYGLKIDGGIGGIQLEESNISFYTNNVGIFAHFGINPQVYLNHAFAADNSGVDGVYVGAGAVNILQMTGCWATSSGNAATGSGLHVAASNSAAYVIVTGGSFFNNSGYAFNIESGHVVLAGLQVNGGLPNVTGDVLLGTGVTACNITGTDITTITNSSSITPLFSANSGYNTDQSAFSTNNLYRFSTSTTGQAGFALLNNSNNFLQNVMYGTAFAGTTAGVNNANASLITASGATNMLYGSSNTAPLVFYSNQVERLRIAGTGQLSISTSEAHKYRGITALRTLDESDYLVNCTSNSFTVTLPTAVGCTGRQYIIKNTGGATVITIATTSSQTIDGAAPGTVTTTVPLRVMSDGANWITF